MNFTIRKAKKSDSKEIIRLINELADFEKLTPPDKKAQRRIIRDGFSKNPRFQILLALENDIAIGYAFYFYSYSTFLARPTLYLEDIFISENYRGYGIGKKLFLNLVKIAKQKKCGRVEWLVLDWNKTAIDFYKKLGSKEMKEWKFFRLTL